MFEKVKGLSKKQKLLITAVVAVLAVGGGTELAMETKIKKELPKHRR